MDNNIKLLVALEEHLNTLLPDRHNLSAKSDELIAAEEQWSEVVWEIANSSTPAKLSNKAIQEALVLIKRPVFICGVHRSGTTLLSNLLDDHDQLLSLPPEGIYLTQIRSNVMGREHGQRLERFCRIWAIRLVKSSMVPPNWYLGRSDGHRQPYVEFVLSLIAWIEALEPLFPAPLQLAWHAAVPLAYINVRKSKLPLSSFLYWVDKTPENEFYLKELWESFPEAKVLHMVRSPGAVYASRYRLEELARKKVPDARVVRSFLKQLADSHQLACRLEQKISPKKYKVVKYEKLVENPNNSMDEIAGFLGIEITDSLYQQTSGGYATSPNTSFVNEQRLFINTDDRGGKLVAAYTGSGVSRLGYEIPRLPLPEQNIIKCRLWLSSLADRIRNFLYRKLRLK